MNERRRMLLLGALCGGFMTAGLLFVVFWWRLATSPNAGAMVEGVFRPYSQDSSIHAIGLGGAVLLAGGLGFLGWEWRKGREH
jgi:hypothetical protein